MTTEDFIAYLEKRRLISAGVGRQLRAKAAQGDNRINSKSILKYLVKKEIVSRDAAKEILQTTLVVSDKAESSILGDAALLRTELRRADRKKRVADRPAGAAEKPPRRAGSSPGDDLFGSASVLSSPPPAVDGYEAGDEVVETFALGEHADELAKPQKSSQRKAKKKGRRDRKEKGQSEWDSPLVLMGGAGVALLLIAGVVLYYLYTRENADLVLKQANELFESGSYSQAIGQYERFVKNWPSHENSSQARVNLGIAKIRQQVEGGDFARALSTAEAAIDSIEDEPAFTEGVDERGLSEGKRELSELLTKIAEGLAQQADALTAPDVIKQRVEQVSMVLALTANTKYVPTQLRQGERLNAVQQTLERVQLRLQRDADLASTLDEMSKAIAAGDSAAAFTARSAVIEKYPVLIDDASLGNKVQEIAAAEQGRVKFVEGRQAASTDAAPSPLVAEITLAERRGAAADATAAGNVAAAVVKVDGAVYALNPADGALLWRRFVGLEWVNSHPLLLPDGTVVTADSRRGELVGLNAQSGKLLWRQPLEGRLATPVSAGERLLVASESGKLFVLQTSGELLGHVQFPQPLRVAPGLNEAGDRIYVVGEHSNLYTLSARDFACLGVHYVGHASGGVVVPPLVVLNKVAVADNSGAETCVLKLLTLDDQGAVAQRVAAQKLAGLVTTPMQKSARRVATVTTRGQANVFEISAANDDTALTAIASREPQDHEQIARFSAFHEGALWVAGKQLLKLAILPTGNQLQVRSIDRDYRGDAFDYPLQTAGSLLLHVRRPNSRGGAIIAATDATDNRALWETEIAVPPAGPPAADVSALRITAGASSGAVFSVDRDAMTRRIQDRAVRADLPPGQTPLMTESLDLGQGRMVLGGVGAQQMLLYRPADPRQQISTIELPGPASCRPVAWGDGFAAASDVGQVFLYDGNGAARGTPFQPELAPGKTYHWLQPALVGEGAGAELVISDGHTRIYRVGFLPQPQPRLEAVATGDLPNAPLTTPLVAMGSRAYAGNDAGALVNYSLPDLKQGEPLALGGRVSWGPHAVGSGLLLATDAGELVMVGDDGGIRWRQKLSRGFLAGEPLVDGATAVAIYATGGIARINLADGAEAAFVELGQPVVEGPVGFGPRLILTAADGSLLVVNRP